MPENTANSAMQPKAAAREERRGRLGRPSPALERGLQQLREHSSKLA